MVGTHLLRVDFMFFLFPSRHGVAGVGCSSATARWGGCRWEHAAILVVLLHA